MCVCLCVCVCSESKKIIFGEHLAIIYQLFYNLCIATRHHSFLQFYNSIICRTYPFPKVQLNLISPSHTGLIFSRNDTGVGTIPRLPLSLNLPLAFKNEDS